MHFLGPVVIPRQSLRPPSESPDERRAYLEQVQMEHRRIYQAIERQDGAAARRTLRKHLEAGRNRYRRMFQPESNR